MVLQQFIQSESDASILYDSMYARIKLCVGRGVLLQVRNFEQHLMEYFFKQIIGIFQGCVSRIWYTNRSFVVNLPIVQPRNVYC